MTATNSTITAKDGNAVNFNFTTAAESVSGNTAQAVYLKEPVGEALVTPMQQTGGSVTALNSGAITNPTSILTRPSSAVSSSTVTATSANPCVFTWTANPLVNGQTVILSGTVPTGGNFVSGNIYYVVAKATNTFELAASFNGTALSSSSTASGLIVQLVYMPTVTSSGLTVGALIASSATSPVVPFFTIPNAGGAFLLSRIRLWTNITSGWQGANLQVNLWSALPTYSATGDGNPYGIATGAAGWLGQFVVSLNQFGDGAAGAAGLQLANQASIDLSGVATSVFFDIQALSQVTPAVSQTFTIIPELVN